MGRAGLNLFWLGLIQVGHQKFTRLGALVHNDIMIVENAEDDDVALTEWKYAGGDDDDIIFLEYKPASKLADV
ncbi:unnamed protein product [Didymodactylos carnosus]|uniref:Uncharacterized protein n=1 Tax=Didymodactylos carnosus TaxID=1234261 RepID=A0A8S2HT90_9BILA|nr:unnamed protein product [Didymodactylos carnosus]CAF3680859.1 unnamed protein product [Didymodactylos carnosus]